MSRTYTLKRESRLVKRESTKLHFDTGCPAYFRAYLIGCFFPRNGVVCCVSCTVVIFYLSPIYLYFFCRVSSAENSTFGDWSGSHRPALRVGTRSSRNVRRVRGPRTRNEFVSGVFFLEILRARGDKCPAGLADRRTRARAKWTENIPINYAVIVNERALAAKLCPPPPQPYVTGRGHGRRRARV